MIQVGAAKELEIELAMEESDHFVEPLHFHNSWSHSLAMLRAN
jgi:hypothetical protein